MISAARKPAALTDQPQQHVLRATPGVQSRISGQIIGELSRLMCPARRCQWGRGDHCGSRARQRFIIASRAGRKRVRRTPIIALVACEASCVPACYFFLPRSSFAPVDFGGLSPNGVWAVTATFGFSFFGFLASRFPRS